MKVEIAFTGLCSFLNVNGKNQTMVEPSVILVRTDDHGGHNEHAGHVTESSSSESAEGPPGLTADNEHIPFIAFNTTNATVMDIATGQEPPDLAPVPDAPASRFLRLAGHPPLPEAVLIEIEGMTAGIPDVDPSYTKVVKKDEYWPQAQNVWNRDYVPEPAKDGLLKKPSKSAVVAFLRFGTGTISAPPRRICPFKWTFVVPGGGIHADNFAEEVVYGDFTHSGNDVVILLKDLETEKVVRTLRFSPKVANQEMLTIFIGNNMAGDMDNTVHRLPPSQINPTGHHFAFLNRVSSIKGSGPIPTASATMSFVPPPGSGGGGVGGVCGPNNSGGPPPE